MNSAVECSRLSIEKEAESLKNGKRGFGLNALSSVTRSSYNSEAMFMLQLMV
jgi:hypothetical protein